jgi:hypothetical protein
MLTLKQKSTRRGGENQRRRRNNKRQRDESPPSSAELTPEEQREMAWIVRHTAAAVQVGSVTSVLANEVIKNKTIPTRQSLRATIALIALANAPEGDRADGRRQLAAERQLAERDALDQSLRDEEVKAMFG